MNEQQEQELEMAKRGIGALSRSFPPLSGEKMTRRIARLERMAAFYESKVPEAPEHQGYMFNGFVNALMYAITIIGMYAKLTKALAELAEEEE